MAEVPRQVQVRVCDYRPCEVDAIGTCARCGRDWCMGHGAVAKLAVERAKLPDREADRFERHLPLDERVEWAEAERLSTQLCNPCLNLLRKGIQTGGFELSAEGP